MAVDNGYPPQTATHTFYLTVTNIDEDLLPDITLSTRLVLENATIGETISRLVVHVKNEHPDDFQFYLLTNAVGKFRLSGSFLTLAEPLDYFESTSHEFVVQAQHTRKRAMVVQQTLTVAVVPTNPCGDKCDNGGQCVGYLDGTYDCECRSGFSGSGTDCENIIDCVVANNDGSTSLGNPCYHGDCVDGINAYNCLCRAGFSGARCAVAANDTNPCTNSDDGHAVCRNGGVCQPGSVYGYSCHCPRGWTGITCELSVDECEQHHCFAGALCVDIHNTYLCNCPRSRVGERCEFYLSSCIVDLCHIWEMCVPSYNNDGYLCALFDKEVKLRFTPRAAPRTTGDREFKALFYDFFYGYVLFSHRPAVTMDVGGVRKRRSLMNDSSVYVYIERTDGNIGQNSTMSIYVSTKDGEVYDALDVLTTLLETCERISKHKK